MKLTRCLALAILAGCSASAPAAPTPAPADPYLWLEDIEGERALNWVRERNERSLKRLQASPRYAKIEADVRAILLARDRIPMPAVYGAWVYNYWQDAKSVRGIWRRATPEEYAKDAPAWETVLDLDALAAAERENWVWKGADALAPACDRFLVRLSRGGKDAVVVREFDATSKSFVEGGFSLPEAKHNLSWKDPDTLFVATDFGPGSLTDSGYPRIVKLWRRGTPLAEAKTVFEGTAQDVAVAGFASIRPEGTMAFVERAFSRYDSEIHHCAEDGTLHRLDLPRDANFSSVFQGRLILILRSEWKSIPAGALVAVAPGGEPEVIFRPDERSSLQRVAESRDALYLSVLENVDGRLLRAVSKDGGWSVHPVALPAYGTIRVASSHESSDRVFATYEGFTQPTTLYAVAGTEAKAARKLAPRFSADGLEVRQFEAPSADGTKVPYFVVGPKGAKDAPTILYGYGGFEIPQLPFYLGALGKAWSEAGNVFVLANIRGGGEFGPKWHQGALKEKRQRGFDDFIGVAEDLARRGIASTRRLGIMGGSNGGLLVGACFVQRPELFRAVLCQVPLLDMERYHKLLAGASWVGEYGSVEDPATAPAIRKYSPYQNVKAGVEYPRVFFATSTKDDRVHPGHARKMVARMEEQGHDVLYFENIEGGHGAAANLDQRVRRMALEYAYFFERLTD